MKKQNGFTLVEILASVVVLIAIGSIVAGILASSLRGANKTNTVENIRQNGNYALAQMVKDIQYAQPFNGQTTGLSNDYTATPPYSSSCSPSPGTVYKYISVQYMSVQSADNVVTRYNCDGSTLTAEGIIPASAVTKLIDTTSTTTISLTNCSLSCIQTKTTDTPIIKIRFSIGPKNLSTLPENNTQSSITFETSVIMRNYKN